MNTDKNEPIRPCHVVAMPYPGRGHVNPMMNLCKQLCAAKPDILVSFVVTEEWLGFMGSETKPDNIRFRTLPNVIPSEVGRAKDFVGFVKAVNTKMEAPFEELLGRLEPPPTAVVADTYLVWMAELANRRNIPFASLWTMPASVLSVFHHFELLRQNNQFPAELSERGEEIVDYIPGVSPTRLADLPDFFNGNGQQTLPLALDCISQLHKAQYLLFTSFHELEPQPVQALTKALPNLSVYPVGPCIPYSNLTDHLDNKIPEYIKWLDAQPRASVLYISLGSFLSVSNTQMEEIISGVRGSGVRYLAVSRGGETLNSWVKDGGSGGGGDLGTVVAWCDQLRVLCHPSVGGFLSHCGWNSTLEAVFSGVSVLTFPLFWDQFPNSKAIVDDWKIGWRVRKDVVGRTLVSGGEIARLVRTFMDGGNEQVKELRRRAREVKEVCREAIAMGGSSQVNIEAFLNGL